jgi:hypothetical protein
MVSNQFNCDGKVITRHNHFNDLQAYRSITGYVSCTEEKLWTIFVEEWSVTTTFFFFQYINLALNFCEALQNLALRLPYHDGFLPYRYLEQQTCIVTSFTTVKDFAEHFHTGYN